MEKKEQLFDRKMQVNGTKEAGEQQGSREKRVATMDSEGFRGARNNGRSNATLGVKTPK